MEIPCGLLVLWSAEGRAGLRVSADLAETTPVADRLGLASTNGDRRGGRTSSLGGRPEVETRICPLGGALVMSNCEMVVDAFDWGDSGLVLALERVRETPPGGISG